MIDQESLVITIQMRAFFSGRLFILSPGKLVRMGRGNPKTPPLHTTHVLVSVTHMASRSLITLPFAACRDFIAQLPPPSNSGPSPVLRSSFLAHGAYSLTGGFPLLVRRIQLAFLADMN